ncbi:DUF3871 family protein [Salinimicrobium sediminilitoris]|uniref:DUF3871 family protein n=1 Tax=Salinimicrobium sediminilitoris TaxID=2876715 RepID=UPI001E51BA8E|nr:DUF3871 family protein [Salinimicrobium sediminilitoris]MCC8361009.1 DUF3871 family protein [Salinimicrobium sediminilitoris]
MEITVRKWSDQVIDDHEVINNNDFSGFIEANTQEVSLSHLREDCVIPVFSKDNETTISHYQFIDRTTEMVKDLFPEFRVSDPKIRVSHVVKGRIPSAIGKPVKDLLEHEKTIYYERCAFLINIPEVTKTINGNKLTLSIGGVRAYNQENLYSTKSLEKFKVFIGFTNRVCTNLCVSTDGLKSDLRVGSVKELDTHIEELLRTYSISEHLAVLDQMQHYSLSEDQFTFLIGRIRLYHNMPKNLHRGLSEFKITDSQMNNVIRNYYGCQNFKRQADGTLPLWNLYNLFTEANKATYIDNFLERGLCAYEFVKELGNSIDEERPNWFLNN